MTDETIANNYQRVGSPSNTHVGAAFEKKTQALFEEHGIKLERNFAIELGISNDKKPHKFDLGCEEQKIIVECKSHRWTKSDIPPIAKLTIWNQAMYYFLLAPDDYRKIFFCLKHYSDKHKSTLAEYYIRLYKHLIPPGVEIWEYCRKHKTAKQLFPQILLNQANPKAKPSRRYWGWWLRFGALIYNNRI